MYCYLVCLLQIPSGGSHTSRCLTRGGFTPVDCLNAHARLLFGHLTRRSGREFAYPQRVCAQYHHYDVARDLIHHYLSGSTISELETGRLGYTCMKPYPATSGFLGHPSKQLATLLAGVLSLRFKFGGTDGARTRGLLRDRQAFSPTKLQLRFVLTDQQRQPNRVSDVYQASFSQSQ